jgi:energy-coupling factor transporter ATP-binding protein EcfA2
MFKDFELDLTYKRKITHDVAKNDFISENNKNIHVRKNIIFMGANASGKTTLGKLLCAIYNYIIGRNIEDDTISFKNSIYNKKKKAFFKIEFSINDHVFAFEVTFDRHGLVDEKVYFIKIHKNYYIHTLRDDLYKEPLFDYSKTNKALNLKLGFQSYFLMDNKNRMYLNTIRNISYNFLISKLPKDAYSTSSRINDISLLQEILKVVDPSVDKVYQHASIEKDEKIKNLKTYSIVFKNGDKVEVEDGDIGKININSLNRLSHGTIEAIYFSAILTLLDRYQSRTIFIDEKLSHTHSELEIYLISRIIKRQKTGSQFFYTTHNTDCLDMDIPINCFVFLRRNEDGFNEIVYPDKKLNKNDRRLRNYVQNDFFDTIPNFSALDSKLGML